MKDHIVVDGYSCVISVEHVTQDAGINGSQFIGECYSVEKLSEILNDPRNQPEYGWKWKVDFQDYYPEEFHED